MSHNCKQPYTYGNENIFRECCIKEYLEILELKRKFAITESHPASVAAKECWNRLTQTEIDSLNPHDYLRQISVYDKVSVQ